MHPQSTAMTTIEVFRHDSEMQAVAVGEHIVEIGDPGDVMYIVIEGEIEIQIGERSLEHIGPGGMFGELALIEHKERTATAVATKPSQVVPISQKRFLDLVHNTPFFAVEVMQTMADRLRRMDALLLTKA